MADPLIIFTDEVGSTRRDNELTSEDQILEPRLTLFKEQIDQLSGDKWKVLKSVGDELIIVFEGGTDRTAEAILALFTAWQLRVKNGKSTLRVAIHRPAPNGIARGHNLLSELRRGCANLERVWPSVEGLADDLFGREMNLAARLATLPTGNAFLVSNAVLNIEGGKELKKLQSGLRNHGYDLGPPIPVCRLKGFEEMYGLDGVPLSHERTSASSLWVHEVVPPAPIANHRPLSLDSRRYQAVRTVLTLPDIRRKGSDEAPTSGDFTPQISTLAERCIMEMTGEGRAVRYHLDALFKVEQTWEGLTATLDRVTPELDLRREQWLRPKNDPTVEAGTPKTHTLPYLLFTSCYNEDVDELISQKIRSVRREEDSTLLSRFKITCKLRAESHVVYQQACWIKEDFIQIISADAQVHYYYLAFQIKWEAGPADDFDHFSGIGDVRINMDALHPVAWAMLKGGADGFVIYRTSATVRPELVVQEIDTLCKKRPVEGFVCRLRPLVLHRLSPLQVQDNSILVSATCYDSRDAWLSKVDPQPE